MGQIMNFLSGERFDKNTPPPFLLNLRSSKFFIISTICVAIFTDLFLYAVIVPVIPFALTSRAGVAEASIQHWVSILLATYGAALLVGSPLAGWYGDRSSSRRAPLLIGLVSLGGATVMLCLARTIALFVVGRLLQGLAAAIVSTVGAALLVDNVGQRDIGQAMGWTSISMSIGTFIGPLLGGVVYEDAGYYPVYYMAFGLIALDIFMRLAMIEKKVARQWVDDEPATTEQDSKAEPATTDCEKGLETVTPHNDIEVSSLTPRNTTSKLPPVLSLLSSRRLLAALWGCIVQGSMMTAFDSVLPLFVQRTFHWDSTGAGLIFLALMIPNFGAPLVGMVADKSGPRWLAFTGFMMLIPLWTLLRLVTHDSTGQKVLLCALLVLIGCSLTLVMDPLFAEVTYVVEAKEKQSPGRFGKNGAYAQAYGLFCTAFAAGTLIGPIWAGYVNDAAGWGTMSWSLGLFSISGAIPCLIWTGGFITKHNAKTADERAVRKPSENRDTTREI